ncbi:serine/threonine-protein kinase PLK4-like isoform X2 [Ruditapes philippinarum]|uniref:serine/threonine-protein kinase PLK4-like isoform X2 n=1 Tax=Ruditapes philippinarum TaxID=129788 RepID=UPI00295A9DA7|nr:serine/threonine-protein kinase PLK4-like isoform X2 [Ruditapes philippinarum]
MSESIDDYRVLNLLGKGGFACVYRARAIKTGLEVAIKMIDKKLMKAAGMVMRVKKEVEIHSRLKHPSILELYNYFEDNNYVYLILEMCHNGELQRYLKSNCRVLAEDEARHFMRQILEGMLYLHSYGILHRDLTLANLLLTKDMDVKIADFGLATRLNGPEEKHFTMCGTPNYISPEVASRSAHGLEADVWSLGCMFYTFLVGTPPFDTDTVKTTLNRVIKGDFDLPNNLSPEAIDLIHQLLQKTPTKRIPLYDVMKHPFMLKESSTEYTKGHQNLSIDSGRGTMSTGIMSRMSGAPKPKPMPAIHHIGSKIPEDRENSVGGDSDMSADGYYSGNAGSRTEVPVLSNPAMRHPPSPPVRLRNDENRNTPQNNYSNKMFPDKFVDKKHDQTSNPDSRMVATPSSDRNTQVVDRTPKMNHMSGMAYKNGDTGYCSGNKQSNLSDNESRSHSQRTFDVPRLNLAQAQFDPTKYQERVPTPVNSSGWSCSASLHSNDAKVVSPRDHSDTSAQDMLRKQGSTCISTVSDASSLEGSEFSLQNTKKVLNFEGDSQPNSINEHYYHHGTMEYPINSQLRQNTEFSQKQMYARSNSVDELEFDRPRHKLVDARSNSVDDLDIDDTRDKLRKPSSSKTSGHENFNNCASGFSNGCSATDDCVKSKQACAKQGTELGSPINSARLRPIRQRTRNAIVNIMESGEVCLEFVKQKHREEKVVELFVISQNGLQVSIYQPNNGKGVPAEDQPIALPKVPLKSFAFNELPEKYWKKYQYASRFVKLVRSKTPKVTLYTQRCKCMLMENGPDADFESVFYDANGSLIGAKFTSSSRGMRIIERTGTSLVLESPDMEQRLTQETQKLLEYVKQCRQQCIELETVVTAVQERCSLQEELFPIIIGRRPNSGNLNDSGKFSTASIGTGSDEHNTSNKSTDSNRPPTMTSFDGTVVSTVTDCGEKMKSDSCHDNTMRSQSTVMGGAQANTSPTSSHVRKLNGKDVLRQVMVHEIGWASQHANGEIWVKFFDGTQLGVKSTTTTIKYIDQSGKLCRFQKTDVLPEFVKSRLEKVPLVLEHLLQDSQQQHHHQQQQVPVNRHTPR